MKSTLLKKLLGFTLPLSVIPLVLMMLFSYNFLHKIVENDLIAFEKKTLLHLIDEIKDKINDPITLNNYVSGEQLHLPAFILYDKEMNILARNCGENICRADNKETLNTYLEKVNKSENNCIVNDSDNKLLIIPLEKNGVISAFIVSYYEKSLADKLVIINQTFLYMFLIVVFILFITTVFIIIFSLRLIEPLNLLIKGIKKISAGDLSHTIHTSSDDEIKILVDAFNDMTLKRKETEEKLQELNQDLELKVQNKTEELLQLNQTLQERVDAATKEIEEQSVQLIAQARMAQMGELISMIAHQWRQPLSSISAIVGTLTLDIIMDAYKKEFFEERLESINQLSQHLSSTIDDFRDFFKTKKEAEETTTQEILQASIQIIAPTLESNLIQVELLLNTPSIKVSTYINEVKQVILNILKNAQEALKEQQNANAKIWISDYAYDGYAVLTIEDNAGGIAQNILPKIFDPYFSTKQAKDGTGLGLYMSKTIIQEHCKGKLSVTNTPHGAKFMIQLPLNTLDLKLK